MRTNVKKTRKISRKEKVLQLNSTPTSLLDFLYFISILYISICINKWKDIVFHFMKLRLWKAEAAARDGSEIHLQDNIIKIIILCENLHSVHWISDNLKKKEMRTIVTRIFFASSCFVFIASCKSQVNNNSTDR